MRFMFDAVVEDQRHAITPFAGFVADPQRAAGRGQDRDVTDQPRVKHPGVRRDLRAGQQPRPVSIGRASGNLRQRRMGQRGHGRRAARSIRRHLFAIAPEVESPPGRTIKQRIVRRRAVLGSLHIGGEAAGFARQHRSQFLLHMWQQREHWREPREGILLIKAPLREAGEIEHCGLLQVELALAGKQIERFGHCGRDIAA